MSDPTDTNDDHTFAPLTLPLIPLEDALVLPGMALSVDLASPEQHAQLLRGHATTLPPAGIKIVPQIGWRRRRLC